MWEKLASNEMPKGGPPLTAEEKGVIRSWINDGAAAVDAAADDANDLKDNAVESAERSLVVSSRRSSSRTAVQEQGRVRNAIDSFVIAALEAKGLNLSAEASREVLLRRAYFDLIGLPPSPGRSA